MKTKPPPHHPAEAQPGRVARRRARVRADLLSAARQVFTTRGYQAATISEIIQIADVAMGTFYLHFPDKEALLVALAEEGLATIREQLHATIAQAVSEPLLPLLMRTLLRIAYQQRDLFLLIGAGESGLLARTRTRQAEQGLAGHFVPLLQQAQERGQLASTDPVLLAHLLVGLLMQAISWWFQQDQPGPDAMADQLLSLLEQGLPPSLLTATGLPPAQGAKEAPNTTANEKGG
jgi:AcrR family transcriptional regulator